VARKLIAGREERVPLHLRKGDEVVVEAGETIPATAR